MASTSDTPSVILDDADRRRLIELYDGRYRELGHDIRTLGWSSRSDQCLRFDVLGDIADLHGCSVCDVGCGFGDLFPYLRDRFGDVSYTGIDLVPALVTKAAELHPTGRFLQMDLIDGTFGEPFDYFLLSGALNFRIRNNLVHSRAMITRMFELARKGVAVNFLSTHVNFERPANYHHDPQEMLAFAMTLTSMVTLRHDYPLWEFTLHLNKGRRRRDAGEDA